jgi:predicted deacylase
VRIRRETFFSLELPYRERLALERTVFEGGTGPRLAVVSGIHGDELEGLYVCHRLAAWLEALEKSRPEALLGALELYPALNPLGLDTLTRAVPIYGVDLTATSPATRRACCRTASPTPRCGCSRARPSSWTSTPATSTCGRSRRCASRAPSISAWFRSRAA